MVFPGMVAPVLLSQPLPLSRPELWGGDGINVPGNGNPSAWY